MLAYPEVLSKVLVRVSVGYNCLLRPINIFMHIKSPSSLSYKPYFFYCLPMFFLLDLRSLILKLFIGCDFKFSVGRIQIAHMDFLPSQSCGRLWRWCQFFYCTCHHQSVRLLQGNPLRRVGPRGTKSHWVHPYWIFWLAVRKYSQ